MKNLKLTQKLVLGMSILSAIGLIAAFIVVNTTVRSTVYDNVLGLTQRDKAIYAEQVDTWLGLSHQIINNLSSALLRMGIDSIHELEAGLMLEFDFLLGAYMGFDDGTLLGFHGFAPPPPPEWDARTRLWHIEALAAGIGNTITTTPFLSVDGNFVATSSRYLGMVEGRGTVVAANTHLSYIVDTVASFDVAGDGYLFIVGAGGEIIAHPNPAFMPSLDNGIQLLSNIQYYAPIASRILSGEEIIEHPNFEGEDCYFMQFYLPTTGWYLVAVIPTTVASGPVWQTLSIIIILTSAILLVVTIFTFLFVSRSFLRPLKETSGTIREVTKGNLNVNIKRSATNDEIGGINRDIFELVEIIKNMVQDVTELKRQFSVVGDIEYTIDESKYQNSFKDLMQAANGVVGELIQNILIALDAMNKMSDGDFSIRIHDMPGKRQLLPDTFHALANNLKNVSTEIESMVDATSVKGDLSFRIAADSYKGDWRNVMIGLNNIAIAVATPISVIDICLNEMQKGNFKLKEMDDSIRKAGFNPDVNAYSGVFNSILSAVDNTVIEIQGYIDEITLELAAIARGDLTTQITRNFVGDFAPIKESINNISVTLNKTISEISVASEQMLSGAKQISISAQELANGAQEQASSVEELNATIDVVNQQTRQNAENALEASAISDKSTINAQEGNASMKEMLAAMTQIKESSGEIAKIIKAIQEIAFQTNLLALNASVEAARAGEHGKGFSVVAEEVRNLAGRSQNSVSETTNLIEISNSRVESGSGIAEATSKSLDMIVTNADEVSLLISNISIASKEQAEAIAQISEGLGQISKVTQSNSAVSEETAAASEELNSQAELLRQLVSYFKL